MLPVVVSAALLFVGSASFEGIGSEQALSAQPVTSPADVAVASPQMHTQTHAFVLAHEDEAVPQDVIVEPGTAKAWALLACSVLFERNGSRHDLLGGNPSTKERVRNARELLSGAWGIETRADLMEALEQLALEGHRTRFDETGKRLSKLSQRELEIELAKIQDPEEREQAAFSAEHWPRLSKIGILAWDLTRYVALCRWGYAAGFLNEAEAWERIFPIAQKLQKAYRSWEDLGEGYLIGYQYWGGPKGPESRAAFEKLKSSADSPWKTTRWNVKLDINAKTPKKKAPK